MLNLTVYAGARSTTPHDTPQLSWDAFAAELAALCREESTATDKRDLPAFGPYALRAGATRSAANVKQMAPVAALDLDGVDVAQLRARIAELGVSAVLHGSPSDDEHGTRKLRAYVQLDSEHAPADAGTVRASVASLLGVQHDPACSNADRIYFAGRLACTPERYFERFDGKPLALASVPRVAVATRVQAPALPARETRPETDAATYAVLGALGSWERYEGRKHAVCGALGGMLRHAHGWTRDECAALIRAWLPASEPGVDVEAGVRWACAAWDKPEDEVSGRTMLDSLVGEAAGAVIEEALLLPWRVRGAAPAPDAAPASGECEFATLEAVDLTAPLPPLRYVVPALELAPGKCSAVQGYAYTSKTPWALQLGLCVAAGVDFLGSPVEQGGVAYLDHEPSQLTAERAQRVRAGLGAPVDVPFRYFRAAPLSDASLDDVRALARTSRLIVLDTYSSAVPATGNFNDSSFRQWADALGRISAELDVLVLLLLHENKSAEGADLRGISGHGSLAGALQAAIKLQRASKDDSSRITVSCARATRAGFAPFDVIWRDVPCEHAPDGTALLCERADGGSAPASAVAHAPRIVASDGPRVVAAGLSIVAAMQPGLSVDARELARYGGGSRAASLEALARLTRAGVLALCAGHYALPRSVSESTLRMALGEVAGFAR